MPVSGALAAVLHAHVDAEVQQCWQAACNELAAAAGAYAVAAPWTGTPVLAEPEPHTTRLRVASMRLNLTMREAELLLTSPAAASRPAEQLLLIAAINYGQARRCTCCRGYTEAEPASAVPHLSYLLVAALAYAERRNLEAKPHA